MFDSVILIKGAKDQKRRPPTRNGWFAVAQRASLIILSFEIEYRASHTIKGDTNGGLGWNQVHKFLFIPQIFPATKSQLS